MKSKDEYMRDEKSFWYDNVGTDAYPVTVLHEYAVALIWEELNRGLNAPISARVLTASGDMSGDLLDGIERVALPNNLSPIAGMVPDIALYDSGNMPVRVIEVEVANPVSAKKQEKYAKLGVELVRVSVSKPEDLTRLCWTPAMVRFWHNVRRNPSSSVRAQRYYEEKQSGADKMMLDLLDAMQRCSLEVRRQFLNAVRSMRDGEIEALHPISPSNPKWETISERMPGLSNTLPPKPPNWAL